KNQIIPANQSLKRGFSHYMLKFANSQDSLEIGKLEYVYSIMAKDAKIDMPETKLLKGKKNSYFAIKRFDRKGDERVHIHSLAALVHSDFRFPSIDYDDILNLTLHLTKDINEVIKVYRLAVFNLLTYNRDDHAKNFSFLLNSDNKWEFAPAYDLTFSYGVNGEHATTYLNEGKNPTKSHLEKLALKHNIKEYKTIIEEVNQIVKNFKKYCKEIGVSSKYANEVFSSFVKFD
ncbi:phosphatidylinositol kinase, partial [Candidatus Gracilibacteria bacterium]